MADLNGYAKNYILETLEEVRDSLGFQPYYWGRVVVAYKSWWYRMFILNDSDLEDKVPKNNLRVHSTFCDKSHWTMGDGAMNFWNSINEGYYHMMWDFFS
jgi:hypothetical protein